MHLLSEGSEGEENFHLQLLYPQQVCICIHICVYAGGTSIETHRIN